MDKALIAKIFNEEVSKWEKELITSLQESLDKKKIRASENLINSLRTIIKQANEDLEGTVFSLAFADYGRHRDMRKLLYSGQPNVEAIKDWVESIGIGNFKNVPGYKSRGGYRAAALLPSNDMVASRIAWGIAKNMQRKRVVTWAKKQVWYNSTIFSKINELENRMAKAYTNYVINEMIKSVK